MELGKKIEYYRKQKQMTQEALANMVNVSNQAVSKWESGQSCPDITLLCRLADIFEVTLDELFDRVDKTEGKIPELPWEDDGKLRAVIYVGHQLCLHEKLSLSQQGICENVKFIYEGAALNIDSEFSVNCGDVLGNVCAGGGVECGDVSGNISAGDSVDCGDVAGSVAAGDNVNCGNISGNVSAGDSVYCKNMLGKE